MDEHSEVEMRCRTQQGANAWGKVEGVMLDRNILKKLKRKVLRACVEICDATKQFNRKIGEKQGEMAGHMVRMDADTLVKRMEEKGEKTSRMQEKGNEQLRSKDCVRWDMRRSGEDERWRGGSR